MFPLKSLGKVSLALSTAGAVLVSPAFSVDFITVLDDQGVVYNLDTSSGVTTTLANVSDPTGESWSPNSIGYSDGTYFYSTFAGVSGFFSSTGIGDGTSIGTNAPITAPTAAGDAFGDVYYYLDNSGGFGTVDVSTPTPHTQTYSTVESAIIGGNYGDIAMQTATNGFLSFAGGIAAFDVVAGVIDIVGGPNASAPEKFLGLAFGSSGTTLWGVADETDTSFGDYGLYSIDTATLSVNAGRLSITGDSAAAILTDAARSPIPEPSVYVGMAFALGLFGYRRFKSRSSKAEAFEAA